MASEKEMLQNQIAELQAKVKKIDIRREALGEENWAADQFHKITCNWNHTDGCGYEWDKDEMFNVAGTAKNREKKKYLKVKSGIEKAVTNLITHEEALKIIKAVHKA